MAFYTAQYIRRLVKEDQASIQKHLATKTGDFRSYLDSTLPFTLYIHINRLEQEVVTAGSEFITIASRDTGLDPKFIITSILDAYKKVINYYIDSYPVVPAWQLNEKLIQFTQTAITGEPLLPILQKEFSKTICIKETSKRDTSVMILSPSFKTIQSAFGKKFRDLFDFSSYSDDRRNDGELDSPRSVISNMLNKNFGMLQNLGHVEIDVISSTGTEVKRGLVTPKLLGAIVDLPKDVKLEPIVKQFSKITGQAETRIVVRKKFESGKKLVFEMLVEAGFMVGTVESRAQNLGKAPKEQAFQLGKGLTDRIRKDKNFLINLETSKSFLQYISEAVLSGFRNKTHATYTSETKIVEKTKVKTSVPQLSFPVKTYSKPVLRIKKAPASSSINLLAILQAAINAQVAKNMGTGSEHRILNYRTGRLAESVSIPKISESRQGMISVFYSYMKNPYATFSEGGRQQYPKTRDPKLLISQSIRDIATPIVGNRLRSVVV